MATFVKIFISIFLFYTFSILNSYSEVVKKLEIQGNERISKETIVVFGAASVTASQFK